MVKTVDLATLLRVNSLRGAIYIIITPCTIRLILNRYFKVKKKLACSCFNVFLPLSLRPILYPAWTGGSVRVCTARCSSVRRVSRATSSTRPHLHCTLSGSTVCVMSTWWVWSVMILMDLSVTDWWTVFCSSSSGKHQASVKRWRLWYWGTERSRKAGGCVCVVSQRVHLSCAPLALYAVPHGGAVAETSALRWLWRDVPQPLCAALPKDLTDGQKQNQTLLGV